MVILFIIAADVAVAATILAVTSRVILHALLYLAVSLIAVAMAFYTMGAPFVAALEVIIYAGAIVVLFLFAVMLLAPRRAESAGGGRTGRAWLGPVVLALVLLGEVIALIVAVPRPGDQLGAVSVGPTEVGRALFGPYAIGVELASMLLLVALIGARHLGGRIDEPTETIVELEGGAAVLEPPEGRPPELGADLGEPGEATNRATNESPDREEPPQNEAGEGSA
jgi:NADH-quinone oxidoreductase subunit J